MSKKSFIISLAVLLVTIGLVALIAQRGSPVVVQTNLKNTNEHSKLGCYGG